MGACGVCTFLQYPLLALEQTVFHGQQYYTNWLLLLMVSSSLILPMYLLYFHKKLKSMIQKTNTATTVTIAITTNKYDGKIANL